MVKPDVKVNYYQALELGSDASIDEIKKQYRKLALKYHPDRNPGKEDECGPKFQAIAAAHEILGDATTKSKYDTDRRRANLSGPVPKAAAAAAAAGRTGNPYTATSNFAPPPRRTQDPTGWSRSGATGAERFANFPGPSPTARAEPKTSAHAAWSSFGGGRKASQRNTTQPQQPAPTAQQRTAPPPVPPRDTSGPRRGPPPELPKRSEAEIRAGMKYKQAPTGMSADTRSAWAHYNDSAAQRPSYSRTNTGSRTPKTNAYNPLSPGSGERPASGGTSGYSHHYKDPEPPSPMQARQSMPPPPPHPQYANGYPRSRQASVDGRPVQSQYRHSTAYQYPPADRPPSAADGLKRSQSYRDNTKLGQSQAGTAPYHYRHRSASPPKPDTNGTNKQDFQTNTDSASSTSSEAPLSPGYASGFQNTGAFGANRPRPKKVPTGPSVRVNGAPNGYASASNAAYQTQSRRGSQAASRQNSASAQGGQGPSAETLFHMHFDFDSNDQAKSRSAEEINTTFSPTSAAPTFSGTPGVAATSPSTNRRSSPSKRGRGTLSAQASRSHMNSRMSNDQFRTPASPTSAPSPQLFGEVKSTATAPTPFSADQWQNHDFFSPQQTADVSRGPSLRRASHSTATARGPTAPDESSSSLNAQPATSSAPSTSSSGDAMDIDTTPPATTEKTSRPYAQPPSEWRKSQSFAQPPPSTRRRSSARSATSPPPSTTLPDLSSLNDSLNPQPGLADLSNLSNPLPHQSRPAPSHASRLFAELSHLPPPPLPLVPTKIDPPQRLTKSSFAEYTAKMHRYLSAIQQVQRSIADNEAKGMQYLDRVVGAGPQGLQAGEMAGKFDGVEGLGRWLGEEERWVALREKVVTEQKGVVEEFVRVKGRVRKLAEEGRLAE